MKSSKRFRVDWHDRLQECNRFFQGAGGILLVRGSAVSAGTTFLAVIRDELRANNWLTIQLNPTDENTRDKAGILSTFVKKCANGSRPVAAVSPQINLAAGITARDVKIIHPTVKVILDEADDPSLQDTEAEDSRVSWGRR